MIDWDVYDDFWAGFFPSETAYLESLRRLHTGFTRRPDRFQEYSGAVDLAMAYARFYLPTHYPKWRFVVDRLPSAVRDTLRRCVYIDIGGGPGTFSLARLGWEPAPSVHLVDRSPVMLKTARRVLERFTPDTAVHLQTAAPAIPPGRPLCVMWGNIVNEAGTDAALAWLRQLSPDLIIMIEPGTPAFFKEVYALETACAENGYQTVYPCPVTRPRCPLRGCPDRWCYQHLVSVHGAATERTAQQLGLDRRHLPFIARVWSRDSVSDKDLTPVRLVRLCRETKHSFELEICRRGADSTHKLQVPKKILGKSTTKKLRRASAGMGIDYTLDKPLPDGSRAARFSLR